ncbi:MAG: acetyl esterase [Myxococcota bacterium]
MITKRKLRSRLAGAIADRGIVALSRVGRLHPKANPARYGVRHLRGIAYRSPSGAPADHLLDVYQPMTPPPGGSPALLYLHGGGFRILSKDTHWSMALPFAARGYTVFVPNYRLAPAHAFPAAVEDAAAALTWVVRQGATYNADPSRLVLAGESAGANLAVALTIATHFDRPEPVAQELGRVVDPSSIKAVLPACGIFEVSDTSSLGATGVVDAALRRVSEDYLRGRQDAGRSAALVDVLPFLERAPSPTHPLPPCFQLVGGADVLAPHAVRLDTAWSALGARSERSTFPGGVHAFHALLWTKRSREARRAQFAFLGSLASLG